jgi:APA family basic amino acid/polyamine antiporter
MPSCSFKKKQQPQKAVLSKLIMAALGFVFACSITAGTGQEIVNRGFLWLFAGIPVYVWQYKKNEDQNRAGAD